MVMESLICNLFTCKLTWISLDISSFTKNKRDVDVGVDDDDIDLSGILLNVQQTKSI